MFIKLSDYAKKFGVTYRTAWNRYKKGWIDGAFVDDTGHVCVPMQHFNTNKTKTALLYCRVSNAGAKDNLERQKVRTTDFAIKNGYKVGRVLTEIASGMNDNRPKLQQIFDNIADFDVLIVENKDRLTRFGFNYIKNHIESHGKELVVINENDDEKTDLVQDLVSIIYSFSARLYGSRRAKNIQKKTLEIIEAG